MAGRSLVDRNIFHICTDCSDILRELWEAHSFFPAIFHSGWLIAILLSMTGVLIVARNQIFIGAAITQTSTFGISIALYILGFEAMSDTTGQAREDLIVSYSILAASICTLWAFVNKSSLTALLSKLKIPVNVSKEAAKKQLEDITGWLFLLSSAGAIVLLSQSPVGKEVIDKLIFSTIIGAEMKDVKILITLFAITVILLILFLDKLTLVFTDRDYAVSIKLPATRIEVIFALLSGVILGFCLKISGTLYTFGCLILPVLIAANFVKSIRILFLISPIIAFTFSFIGFAAGNYYDIPQTQLTIFFMSLFYPVSLIIKGIFLRN